MPANPQKPRHPELVSGSIRPFDRSKRRQAQANRQVDPMRIAAFDQVDLPLAMPAFELLFAQDRWLHFAEQLEMHQAGDAIAAGKPLKRGIAVLRHARGQIGRHADVQCTVGCAGEDIDTRKALSLHLSEFAAQWTLKQVQGDVNCIDSSIRHAELVSASIPPQARCVIANDR